LEMKTGKLLMVLAGVAISIAVAGCETTPVQQGALTGGVLGAGAGAIIGNQFHHSAGTGALIGGLGGAAAGALIGEQTGHRGGVAPSPSAPPPPPPVVYQQAPVVYQPAPIVYQPYPVVERGTTILIDPEDYYYVAGGVRYHHYYRSQADVVVRTVPPGYHYLHNRIDIRSIPQRHFRHPEAYYGYHPELHRR
jgi:osmotically inducible lipoprotein OsmB